MLFMYLSARLEPLPGLRMRGPVGFISNGPTRMSGHSYCLTNPFVFGDLTLMLLPKLVFFALWDLPVWVRQLQSLSIFLMARTLISLMGKKAPHYFSHCAVC